MRKKKNITDLKRHELMIERTMDICEVTCKYNNIDGAKDLVRGEKYLIDLKSLENGWVWTYRLSERWVGVYPIRCFILNKSDI